MYAQNLLICADNASGLRTLADSSIDLCYIDPPFFSSKRYDLLWKGYELRSFTDTFDSLQAYLEWMEIRIRLIHQKLKPSGSFYLHCDWHASHYLKVLCDKVFGYAHFLNEIVWSYQGTGESKRYFKRKHDVLLFYAKTKDYFFSDPDTVEPIGSYSLRKYTHKDAQGRFKRIQHPDGTWHKQYMRTHQRMRDVWEIPVLNANTSERVGYQTQKPEALLKRIIQASAPPDGWVLDCFVGSGTTATACAQLKRHFIAIDTSPVAIRVSAQRLRQIHAPYQIIGLPNTWAQIQTLCKEDLIQWLCQCMGWTHNTSSSSDTPSFITAWANRSQVPVHIATHPMPIPISDIENFVTSMATYSHVIYVAWTFAIPTQDYLKQFNNEHPPKLSAYTLFELCSELCTDPYPFAPALLRSTSDP